ncbi:MAG: radical SAM protein [Dehalococcoidia bacterium]|nr:MAG: radical SAM protein [Dehalococcoidia bacterium]
MEFGALNNYHFETGPIRPPSEAYSLLIRATRNCPWNRCRFCVTYKDQKFELRPVEDILEDIRIASRIVETMQAATVKSGYEGREREVHAFIYGQSYINDCVRQVALWQWAGGTSAFLQDANSIIMRTPDLVNVLSALKSTFPRLSRITSYCRSKTAAKKTAGELTELQQAGLSRIHVGMESGSDAVLTMTGKGMTAEDHIKGGRNIKGAGIELSEYFMPGLGGRKLSAEHASESARVLNEVDPDFIRLRTLSVMDGMPLWENVKSGELEVQGEDEVVREIGEFIEKLDFNGVLKSDHILNLLPEIEGKFPEAKQDCLDVIKRYLALPLKDRLNFRLGRRAGLYENLNDIYDARGYQQVDEALQQAGADTEEKVDELIAQLKEHFI